ncbi:hypothetical protein [Aliikangiella maris]|uniref:Uncharacterized protein n=2 Tax=Aliikangiella maris TaxID=3162458 RepID=A0ABV2BUY9_9GAMM
MKPISQYHPIAKYSLYVLAITLIFILSVLLINTQAFDEKSSPAVNLVMQPQDRISPQYNAYFYFLGLLASNAQDPHEAGQKLQQKYVDNREKLGLDQLSASDSTKILQISETESWFTQFERCHARTQHFCFQQSLNNIKALDFNSPRLIQMLKRYARLTDYQDYQSPDKMTFASPIPAFGYALSLQQISLAHQFSTLEFDSFLIAIEKDINFWRTLLLKSDILIVKMVAIAAIWYDVRYLSNIISQHHLSSVQVENIQQLLRPLNNKELDLSNAFRLEAQTLYNQLAKLSRQNLQEIYGIKISFFDSMIQVHATQNLHFERYLSPMLVLSKLNSSAFYDAVQQGKTEHVTEQWFSLSPSNLYNPGGKLLLQNINWSPSDYIARMHDMNGMFNLVKLQLELKNQSEFQPLQWVNDSAYRNIYTLEPLIFNEQKQTLEFECLSKKSLCSISFGAHP